MKPYSEVLSITQIDRQKLTLNVFQSLFFNTSLVFCSFDRVDSMAAKTFTYRALTHSSNTETQQTRQKHQKNTSSSG
jgi:hypothetical protein